MKTIFFIIAMLFAIFSANSQVKKWTLKDCVKYALEHNISIKKGKLDLQNSEIELKGAKGDFLPDLNANIRHSWNTGLNTDRRTNTNVVATTQNSNVGITANMTLYNGLKNLRQLHKSNLSILANQYQLADIKTNISLLVANVFLQIVFNKESLKTLKKQYELSKKEYIRTKELVHLGAKPKGDLLEIEVAIAEQEQQIITTKNAVQISKITLTNLLQIKKDTNFEISEDTYELLPSSILKRESKEIYNKALDLRNEVKFSKINVEIAKNDLKIAKGNYQPTLSGFYNFNTGYFSSKLEPDLSDFSSQLSDNSGHSFGLSLNIPIFNKFSISNEVKRLRINLEKTKLSLEQTKSDLKDKVNQAYADAQGTYATYKAAKKTLAAREQSFLYSQEKFNEGMINSFDFSQSKVQFEASEIEVIRTKYNYIFKIKILELYFGISVF